MKMLMKHGICLTLLASTLLSGCMTRMVADETDQPEALALGQNFIQTMNQGSAKELAALASMPFWVESWSEDGNFEGHNVFESLIKDRSGDPVPEATMQSLSVRIYPLADLAVLYPEGWQRLSAAGPERLKDLSLAALGLYDAGREDGEAVLMLVRKVEGKWTWAGLARFE